MTSIMTLPKTQHFASISVRYHFVLGGNCKLCLKPPKQNGTMAIAACCMEECISAECVRSITGKCALSGGGGGSVVVEAGA